MSSFVWTVAACATALLRAAPARAQPGPRPGAGDGASPTGEATAAPGAGADAPEAAPSAGDGASPTGEATAAPGAGGDAPEAAPSAGAGASPGAGDRAAPSAAADAAPGAGPRTATSLGSGALPGRGPAPVTDGGFVPPKDPTTAVLLSGAGTLLPFGVFTIATAAGGYSGVLFGLTVGGVAAILTPSMGHWYAGRVFTRGLGVRLVGGAALLWGAAKVADGVGIDCVDAPCPQPPADGMALMALGAATYVGGVILDLVTAGDAARDANEAAARHLRLAPVRLQALGGARLGLALQASF